MSNPQTEKRTARTRELNEALRGTFSGCRIFLTAGVAALPDRVTAAALVGVRRFDRFTPDNDPEGKHDFGSFELADRKFFWKIDLYEEPDISDADGEPSVERVLTIMLAEDY